MGSSAAVRRRRVGEVVGWCLLVGGAGALYGAACQWGPSVLYTNLDEDYTISRAVAFGTGDLNPRGFIYPSLYMYLVGMVYAGVYVVGHVLGYFASPGDFGLYYFADRSVFILSARMLSVVMGVGALVAAKLLDAYFRAIGSRG